MSDIDDTEALQYRIDNTPRGGEYLIPVGRYRISAPLVLRQPITIRGEGTDAYYYGLYGDPYYAGTDDAGTVIESTAAEGAIFDHAPAGFAHLVLQNLHLKGIGDATRSTVGVRIGTTTQGQFCTIRGLRLSNLKVGIALLNVQNSTIDDVWAFGCDVGADLGAGVCANTFINFSASGCGDGVLLGGAKNLFLGGAVQSSQRNGLVVTGEENTIRDVYFENKEALYAIDVRTGADNTEIGPCHYSMVGHDNVRIAGHWCRIFSSKYADTLTIVGTRTQVIGPWAGKIVDEAWHETTYLGSPLNRPWVPPHQFSCGPMMFPDGSKLETAPDGRLVFTSKAGRRTVLVKP